MKKITSIICILFLSSSIFSQRTIKIDPIVIPLDNLSPQGAGMAMTDNINAQPSENKTANINSLYQIKDEGWDKLSSEITDLKAEYKTQLMVMDNMSTVSKVGGAALTDILPGGNYYGNTANALISESVDFLHEKGEERASQLILGAMQQKILETNSLNPDMSDSDKINFISDAIYRSTDNDNRGVSNELVTKVVTKFVSKNSGQIDKILNGQEKIEVDVATLRSDMNEGFDVMDEKILNNTFKIRRLAGAVDQLYKNDEKIFAELDDINSRVKSNTVKIQNNSIRIEANFEKTKINRANIIKNRNLIQENKILISQNTSDISTINNYLLGNLDIDQQLVALEKGELGTSDWSETDRETRIEELTKIKNVESISSMANNINVAIQSGMQVAEVFGLFNSDAGKEVAGFLSKGLEVGSAGVGLATSIMSGNIMGMITNGANLITGIFGGSSEPQKSPELQAIEAMDAKLDHMMKVNIDGFNAVLDGQAQLMQGQADLQKTMMNMQKRIDLQFESVHRRFDQVNNKITKLQNSIDNFRLEMFEQNHRMLEMLERIDNKIDVLQETTELILNKEFRACLDENLDMSSIRSISDLKYENAGKINTCFKGLSITADASTTEWFTANKYRTLESDDYFDNNDKNLKILKDLYFGMSLTNQRYALNQIINPSIEVSAAEWRTSRSLASRSGQNYNVTSSDVFRQLLNPFMVYMVSEKYLKYLPFFEFRKRNQDLYSVEEIIAGTANLSRNKSDIESTLDFLIKSTSIAIAQQSILSGEGMIPHLNTKRKSEPGEVYDLLKNNPRIKRNIELFLFAGDFPNGNINMQHIETIDYLNNEINAWEVRKVEQSYNSLFNKLINSGEELKLKRTIDMALKEEASYYNLVYSEPLGRLDQLNYSNTIPSIKLETMHFQTPTIKKDGGSWLEYQPTELLGISYNLRLYPSLAEINEKFNIVQKLRTFNEEYEACLNAGGTKSKCNKKLTKMRSLNAEIKRSLNKQPYSFTYFSQEELMNPEMQYDPILERLVEIRKLLLKKQIELNVNQELLNKGLDNELLNAFYLDPSIH